MKMDILSLLLVAVSCYFAGQQIEKHKKDRQAIKLLENLRTAQEYLELSEELRQENESLKAEVNRVRH